MDFQDVFKDAVEALYTYGPFAALALFALFVAPRQTKQFLQCQSGQEEAAKIWLCGTVAALTWLIVAALTWVIVSSWPPTEVYRGKLGIHPKEISILTNHDAFYISSRSVGKGRFRWQYAVVADTTDDPNEEFTFTVVDSTDEFAFDDETLTLAQLAAGRIDYRRGREKASVERVDTQTAMRTRPNDQGQGTARFGFIGVAHAQGRMPESRLGSESIPPALLSDLNDDEPRVRAAARGQLRGYNRQTLQSWLQIPDLPTRVRQQIAKEVAGR